MGLFQVPWDTWSQFKCKLNPPISKTIYRYCLWLEFGLRWISIPTELPLTLLAHSLALISRWEGDVKMMSNQQKLNQCPVVSKR